MELSAEEVQRMTTPLWDQIREALRDDDVERAQVLLDRAVARWRSLQDYSVNWIAQLLSFIGREQGEEAVERALREFGETFLRSRRAVVDWNGLPAAARAKAIAGAMLGNFGSCDVEEDDEAITLRFRCGSGGRLIDEGRYDGEEGYLVLEAPAPQTFSRASLPVYCAHCAINNEAQPIEWSGYPVTVEEPQTEPGGFCTHRIYKDLDAIPSVMYERVGARPPDGAKSPEI